MINSPRKGDVPQFLDWMEVVYQNGLVGGYSKIISDADYPPVNYAISFERVYFFPGRIHPFRQPARTHAATKLADQKFN